MNDWTTDRLLPGFEAKRLSFPDDYDGPVTATLVELFAWSATEFDERLRGSPIRRIGYERWLRNLAVGLGNAPSSSEITAALRARLDHPSALVREHVLWALSRHEALAA